MKKIILILLPVILVVTLAGCWRHKADSNSFVIHGMFTNSKKDSVYLLELTVKKTISVDSAVISEDGEFYFKEKPKDIAFYILKMKKNNFITLLIDKNENVELTADARQLAKTYSVHGSKGSEEIMELNLHLLNNYAKVDSLGRVYNEAKGKPNILKVKASLDSTYKEIFLEQKNYLKNFMDKNTNSLACLLAIYQQFGRERMFNTNDKDDFAYFEKIDKALFAAYPNNPHAQDLHGKIAESKKVNAERQMAEAKLAVGAEAPDFTLPSTEGKSVSLSSFKGKNVLIDFWASWCAPCRAENPRMVHLYNKFYGTNFTILGVSLDRDGDAWQKAIKNDKLSWTQVSDLKYWNSPVAQLYNVQAIPYTILVDKDGKIAAKGLRGDSLEMKINEILK